jgi:hypothetical protein
MFKKEPSDPLRLADFDAVAKRIVRQKEQEERAKEKPDFKKEGRQRPMSHREESVQ